MPVRRVIQDCLAFRRGGWCVESERERERERERGKRKGGEGKWGWVRDQKQKRTDTHTHTHRQTDRHAHTHLLTRCGAGELKADEENRAGIRRAEIPERCAEVCDIDPAAVRFEVTHVLMARVHLLACSAVGMRESGIGGGG